MITRSELASRLAKLGKGVPKTMTFEAMEQRRIASKKGVIARQNKARLKKL